MVVVNFLAVERENLVMKAATNPDRKIEIGVLERYHGVRTKSDGTTQNYYRLTLAAAVEDRIGTEESPLYPVAFVIRHAEELSTVEAAGIRELDPTGIYLTLYRNAVINLARKVRENYVSPSPMAGMREAVVSRTGIDWRGSQPGSFNPLSWLRPGGEVIGSDGQSLGTFYRLMKSSQGFLNPSVVANERLEPGDVLQFREDSHISKPIIGMKFITRETPPAWLIEKPWLLRLAGNSLGLAADSHFLPIAEDEAVPYGVAKYSIVKVAALGNFTQVPTTTFTGQWRLQIRKADSDPSGPALAQIGIQADSPVTRKDADVPLQPLDLGAWGLDYTLNALKSLADTGIGKGFKQIIYATN